MGSNTFNNDNAVIYTGICSHDNVRYHGFDLFINKTRFCDIIEWITTEYHKTKVLIWQPMDQLPNINNIEELFIGNDIVWLWLFIENNDAAMHFKLVWEDTNLINK